MDFKTEQQVISYGLAIVGCALIGWFSNPDGIVGTICILLGIIILGFGGILQGSIDK